MRIASLPLLPTPWMPSELDALVDCTTNAVNLLMKESLVPAPFHRRLVPFSDNQLKKLKSKEMKSRARGDINTYKSLCRSFRSCLRAKQRRWQVKLCEKICPCNAWSTVHLLHGLQSKKKPQNKPAPGDFSADRRAAELKAKYAAFSNELSNCSIRGGPSIPFDALSEFVIEEILQRAILKPLICCSAREDGMASLLAFSGESGSPPKDVPSYD